MCKKMIVLIVFLLNAFFVVSQNNKGRPSFSMYKENANAKIYDTTSVSTSFKEKHKKEKMTMYKNFTIGSSPQNSTPIRIPKNNKETYTNLREQENPRKEK